MMIEKGWMDSIAMDTIEFPICLINMDESFTIVKANSSFYKLLGYTKKEMQFKFKNSLSPLINMETIHSLNNYFSNPKTVVFTIEHIFQKKESEPISIYSIVKQLPEANMAYLVCINIERYKACAKDLQMLKNKISYMYHHLNFDVFEYNIDTNVIYINQAHIFFPRKTGISISLNEVTEQEIIHPQYHKNFLHAIQKIINDKKETTMEILIKDKNDQYHYAKLSLGYVEQQNNNIIGILIDIASEKEAISKYLNETRFYHAILSKQNAYGHVNVSMDKVTRVGGVWKEYSESMNKRTFTQIIKEYSNKVVYLEDRQSYQEMMSGSHLMDSFMGGITYLEGEFRIFFDQNKIEWMKVKIHLFKDIVSLDIMALIYIKNIDEQKRKEGAYLYNNKEILSNTMATINKESDFYQQVTKEQNRYKKNKQDKLARNDSNITIDFNDFVGEYGDMAYLIDPQTYHLLCANKAFYHRIGKTERECMSIKCYEAIHQRNTPCPFCGKANWNTNAFYMYLNYNEILEQEFLVKNRLVEWQGTKVVLALAIALTNKQAIVDSLENGSTENRYILSGIEHMQEATTLQEAIYSALENIGQFFRAKAVHYWHFDNTKNIYQEHSIWVKESAIKNMTCSQAEVETIKEWVNKQKWDNEYIVASQEEMLCHCYDMYQIMIHHDINNLRWIPIDNGGLIAIYNVSINFLNVSFMQTFGRFLTSEFSKRDMINTIVYANYHDALTGLLNRNCYESYVSNYHNDEHHSIAIIASNINGLKEINEKGGFDLGNHYLIQLSRMMQSTFGKNNVYRLSGDDYIVIVSDVPKGYIEEKIEELKLEIEELHSFTVSFGYSWDNIEKELDTLVKYATRTMRTNKSQYYDVTKSNHDTRRLQALNAILQGINNHQFRVYLQPKYDNLLNKVVGAEALIRYYHEEYGMIMPGKYIEQLEKDNLIRYIDIFVFEETCRILQKWQNDNRELPVISLNFSRMTLAEQDLLENLEDIFSRYTIDKKKIEIEITESYAEVGKTLIYQSVQKLHNAGYTISLDDFGTKYTNLTILSDISVDVLKVDKSLIHSLVSNQRNQIILKNIISMCKELQIEVIAEGVETKEQENRLKKLGCHLIQGYLYSKPIPINEFEQLFIVGK